MTSATVGRQEAGVRPAVVLAVVSAGVTLANLDLFIVNVAFPALQKGFDGAALSSVSWVLNGYAIVFAALLVPAGRLADRRSRKGGFLLGVAVFTLGSAACAVAPNIESLVAFRVVQAAGAALLVPTSLSLLLAAYPPARRQAAVRIWASMAAVAGALGPAAGGLLSSASWRWIFLVNVPIGVLLFVFAARLLTDSAPPDRGPRPDVFGSVLFTGVIGTLTLALVKVGDWGAASADFVGVLGAAAVLGVAFGVQSARHPSPVLEMNLFRSRGFSLASCALLLFSAAFSAMLLALILWCQQNWGWSALRTGLAIAPGPLLVPIMSALAGRLVPRTGPGPVAAVGCALFAGGVLWFHLGIDLSPDYVGGMLPGFLIANLGIGLTLPTLIAAGAGALPPPRFATGSAVLNMARQLGYVLGVALLVLVRGTPHTAERSLDMTRHVWVMSAVLSMAGAVCALLLLVRRPAGAPAPGAAGGLTAPPQGGPVLNAPLPDGRLATGSASARDPGGR